MRNRFTFLLLSVTFLFCLQHTFGQKALIVGFNYDSPDGITLVALDDLPDTEVLFFTETPYDPSTNTFDRSTANRGTWQVTWTGTWTKGTVIQFEGNPLVGTSGPGGPGAPTATSPYSDGVSFSNEGFSVFTASNASDPDATPTEIYSYIVHDKATSSPTDPDPGDDGDCPCSGGYISVDLGMSLTDHGDYMNALRTDGTPDTKAEFENAGNWDQATTNNTLDLTAFTSISLPVELTSFQAKKQGINVRIEWRTFTEINNDYFTIEQSVDGERFDAIGTVKGAGNSFVPLNYKFVDMAPAYGLNYYRLKQTDYDGAFTYSDIEVVDFQIKKTDSAIYPNPFYQSLTLQFPSSENNSSGKVRSIKVFDTHGRLVFSNSVPMDEINTTLDLSTLHSGVYFMHTLEGGVASDKIHRIIKI